MLHSLYGSLPLLLLLLLLLFNNRFLHLRYNNPLLLQVPLLLLPRLPLKLFRQPRHALHTPKRTPRPGLPRKIQLGLPILLPPDSTSMEYSKSLDIRCKQLEDLFDPDSSDDCPQSERGVYAATMDSNHVSAEGGEGGVGGEIVPGLDFEDGAYGQTGRGVFVEEGAAGGVWVELFYVFLFDEFD